MFVRAAVSKGLLPRVLLACIAVLGALHRTQGSGGVVSGSHELTSELRALRAQRADAVIPFNHELFQKYAFTKGRKYSLVFFLTADYLLDNPSLRLKELYKEFGYTAVAFQKGPTPDQVFFCVIKFEDSQELFRQLGVNTLPYAFHWGPNMAQKASGKLPSVEQERLQFGSVETSAEGMASYVVEKTGAKHAAIDKPSLLKSPLFPVIVVGIMGLAASTAWKFYNSPLARSKVLWMVGSLTIYWFSTSGGMYNIIRGMPMYIVNQERKFQYFMQGRSNQLGVEGFTMGSTYIGFSLALTGLTYVVPSIKSSKQRNTTAVLLIIAAVYLVFKIFDLYKWKNGYWLNIYLP